MSVTFNRVISTPLFTIPFRGIKRKCYPSECVFLLPNTSRVESATLMSHGHSHGAEQPTSSADDFRDVSPETLQKILPSEALLRLLENAQISHRQCLRNAKKNNESPVDKCALTWNEVFTRYRAWAAYRPPFQTSDADSKHRKFWTKKRMDADDSKQF